MGEMRITYVVEMQVLNVEGFEKRVVYNVAKAYTSQLGVGGLYPELNDVIGITICDFELWPDRGIPLLSRWRMREQHTGQQGLPKIQFVFLELPKLDTSREPVTVIEKWAYFFREASSLKSVPPALSKSPHADALDAARTARFTDDEWDTYIRAGMAIQDERGALSLAMKQGQAKGRLQGRAETLSQVLTLRFGPLSEEITARVQRASAEELVRWAARVFTAATVAEVFA